MDLSKGRKSTNVLDRRPFNKSAFISNGGNRWADEKDMMDSYFPPAKEPRVKLGDLYDKTVKALEPKKKAKPKPNPKTLDKYKKI